MNRGCLTIIILPSEVVEGEEVIVLGIDTVSPDAEVVDGETTITILSDGGMFQPLCVLGCVNHKQCRCLSH